MSEKINVDHAFNPEARQAQADLDAYMDSRPYEDDRGNIHNPETNSFINADTYFEEARSAYEVESTPEAYEDMSMSELAKKLANAEYMSDRTKAEDITDALVEKLAAEEDRIASSKDSEHNDQRSENIWNRVMGIKDKELARLAGDNVEETEKPAEVQDELFTYDSQEELDNKDEAISKKAAEADPELDSEIFDDFEAGEEADNANPEEDRKETVQDIIDRIVQRRFDGEWSDELEDADYDKLQGMITDTINDQLDKQGITDPEERERKFEEAMKSAYEKLGEMEDEARDKLSGTDSSEVDDSELEDNETEIVPVVSEATPAKPEKQKWTRRRKIMAAVGGLLMAAGLISTGGKEDKWVDIDFGNHGGNVEAVVDIDETDNALGKQGFSEASRTKIARNAEQAEAFFSSMSTKEGQANFKAMVDMGNTIKQDLMKKHGNSITPEQAEQIASLEVAARLAALAAHEAEAGL